MFKPRSFRNVVLCVSAVIVFIGGAAFGADSGDELLGLIPAESIIAIRVNNFDQAAGQVDQYLAGMSPIPMSLSMMAKMQFGQMLGNPMLTGVNTGGNVGVYLLAKSGETEPVANILLPVSNYAELVSSSQNVGEGDSDGVSTITLNGRTVGILKKAGNYAIFAKNKESVNLADNGLGAAIDGEEKNIATTKPIWAYVNVHKVGEIYGEMAVAQLQKSKTMMADASAAMKASLANLEEQKSQLNTNDPNQTDEIAQLDKQISSIKESIKKIDNTPMLDNFASVIDMYIRVLETLLAESKSFSAAIEPKDGVLTILETYTAMPGSDLAKALVADSSNAKADKLINYLQDGAAANLAGRLNKPLLQRFYSDSMNLMGIMTNGKMSDEEITKFKQMASDLIDSLGGSMALSFWADGSASPPFMEDCIIEVGDVAKFNTALVKAMELWNGSGFMDFYKDMGMNMSYVTKMNIFEYKGAKVNSAKLTFTATDPDSAEAEMITKMYGDGFEYRWAVVDGLCVEAIAGDVEGAIKDLIDEVKAGGANEAALEIKQAKTILADGADDFFGTFNIIRMLKMMSAIPDFPLKNITAESNSNIAFGGKIADGKAVFKIAVPKAHISEVMMAVMPKSAAK